METKPLDVKESASGARPKVRPFKTMSLKELFPDFNDEERIEHNLSKQISKHPFRLIACGPSGTGKTSALINMLTRDDHLKHFFHKILFFSPNVFEPANQLIKIKNPRTQVEMYDDPNMFEDKVKELFKTNEKRMNEGLKKKNYLVIIDDFITNQKFMNSKALKDAFIFGRKFGCSIAILTQNFRSCKKEHRGNSSCIIFFNQDGLEVDKLAEENSIGKFNKKFFKDIFQYLAKEPYEFICINREAPPNKRFFKNFDIAIS